MWDVLCSRMVMGKRDGHGTAAHAAEVTQWERMMGCRLRWPTRSAAPRLLRELSAKLQMNYRL